MSYVLPLLAFPASVGLNTAWQTTQATAQRLNQQAIMPTAQYLQTTWQGGLTPSDNLSLLEKLKRNYVQNQAIELALKKQLAEISGFPQVAAELERQRQGILAQLQQDTASLAFNTVAPNPLIGMMNQWQLTQVLAKELLSKGHLVKATLTNPSSSLSNEKFPQAFDQKTMTTLTPASEVATVVTP